MYIGHNCIGHNYIGHNYVGRQFGPTVLAPFSTVIVDGEAGFVDGSIIARQLRSGSGSTAGQLHLGGDFYRGPLSCQNSPLTSGPTATPTFHPHGLLTAFTSCPLSTLIHDVLPDATTVLSPLCIRY